MGIKGHAVISRGQQGSICLGMPQEHQIWLEEPLARAKCTVEIKGHAGVIRVEASVGKFGLRINAG